MLIKVCGLTKKEQILKLGKYSIAYNGFIFYPKSPRAVVPDKPLPIIQGVKRVGVFVNEQTAQIKQRIDQWQLDLVQLHGEESPVAGAALQPFAKVIKAFGVRSAKDFEQVEAYKQSCDYFLFDAKGPARGGNGQPFNWQVLQAYTLDKPYFLAGGIAADQVTTIQQLASTDKRLHAIDINSQFERAAGDKQVELIGTFSNKLTS